MLRRLYFLFGALLLPFVLVGVLVWLRVRFVPHNNELDLVIGVASLSAGCACALYSLAPSNDSRVDYWADRLGASVSYLLVFGSLLVVWYFVLVSW